MSHCALSVPESLFFELWSDYLERVEFGASQELWGSLWARLGSCERACVLRVRLVALGDERGTVEVSLRDDDAATVVVPLCDLFDVVWGGEQ